VRNATVARSYAEALFELGRRHGALDAYAAVLQELVALIEAEPTVRTFLESPKIETEQKKAALTRALQGRVPPLFLNFVLVVVEKRRQALLPEMAREYDALVDAHYGRTHVQVTLAREPDPALVMELEDALTRVLGTKVIPHVHVDPRILGGVLVRYGDKVMDASLRRRLAALRRRLLQAPLTA
jgi:F-type H+-transporting ATPase subunit delta